MLKLIGQKGFPAFHYGGPDMGGVEDLFAKAVAEAGYPTHVSAVAINPKRVARLTTLSSALLSSILALIVYYTLEPPLNVIVATFILIVMSMDVTLVYYFIVSNTEDILRGLLQIVLEVRPDSWALTGRLGVALVMGIGETIIYVDKNMVACTCRPGIGGWQQARAPCLPLPRRMLYVIIAYLALIGGGVAYTVVAGNSVVSIVFLGIVVASTIALIAYIVRPRRTRGQLCIPSPASPSTKMLANAAIYYYTFFSTEKARQYIDNCLKQCSKTETSSLES